MDLTLTLVNQVIIMLLIMMTGFFCQKRKLISDNGFRDLSNLLLLVVNPLLILMSYQQEFDSKKLQGLMISLGLSAAGLTIMILLSHLFIPAKNNPFYRVERFCITYPNCGFIGIPIIGGIFGQDGVFYLTGVMTMFNLFIWTHGLMSMQGTGGKIRIREVVKSLMTPVIFACFIGFATYLAGIRFPATIATFFDYLSSMNTPLAMLIAGGVLAQADLKKALSNLRVYYVAFLRLVLFPVILLLIFRWLPIDSVLILTIVIALGCSTAAACTAIALRCERDPVYSSEIFAVTTLLIAITLPLIMLLNSGLEYLFF